MPAAGLDPRPRPPPLTVDGQASARTRCSTTAPVRAGAARRSKALVDVDRATAEPGRLGARPAAYARLHSRAGALPSIPRQPAQPEVAREERRPHCPPLPRLLFVLDGTGAAGVDERIRALGSAAAEPDTAALLRDVPVLAAALTDVLRAGPGAPVWRPVQDPGRRVLWTAGAAGQGSAQGGEEACAGWPSHCAQLVRGEPPAGGHEQRRAG